VLSMTSRSTLWSAARRSTKLVNDSPATSAGTRASGRTFLTLPPF